MKMEKKKIYHDVQFVRIEQLRGRAKEVATKKGLKEGLGILKVSVNSPPLYEVEEVTGDPLVALKGLAKEDGITNKQLEDAMLFEKDVCGSLC